MMMALHDLQVCTSKAQLTRSHPTQQQVYTELLSSYKVWGVGRECILASLLSQGEGMIWREDYFIIARRVCRHCCALLS